MADLRRRAAGYSDPRIGMAFESLSDAFAPPSAQEMYAAARAAGERGKTQRFADVWNDRNNPDQAARDRAAIAAGMYNPNQGYYAVDTKNATDQRGQDITSGDSRYNVDSRDRTSRANNADTNQTNITQSLLTPVQKDAVRNIPQSVADMYPGTPLVQRGIVSAQPGERNVLPGGEVIEGAPKPKTRAEVEGDIVAGMSDEEKRAIGFGSTPVVETPKGPMSRPQQLQSGTPALSDKQPQVFNSKNGPVMWDPAKRAYVSPQSGQPVDVSGGLQAPSAAQGKDGTLGPTMANNTDANKKAAQLDVVDAAINSYEETLRNNPGIVGVPGHLRGAAQNALSVVQEFGAAFGSTPLDAIVTPEDAQRLATRVGAGQRDPNIAKVRVQQADLAYKWAQMQNPTGEVSRQAFERALDTFAGGALANNQSAIEAAQAAREVAKRERIGVDRLRNPAASPVDSGQPAAPVGPRVIDTPAGKVTITPRQ